MDRRMTPARRRPLLSREFIDDNRRRTLALAAAELAQESGAHAVTVTDVCRKARSGRNTFYVHFRSVDDCLRLGIREGFDHLFGPVLRIAEEDEGEWLVRVERAVGGFYAAAAENPALAELVLVHSFGVPRKVGESRHEDGIAVVEQLLAQGREDVAASAPMPLTESYLAGVVVSLATLKLRQGEATTLPAQTREVTLLVGSMYLGIEHTARVLGAGDLGRLSA